MDKKRKTVLIAVAAVLLVVAAFLLLRRSQPLGELIPAPETARVDKDLLFTEGTRHIETMFTSGTAYAGKLDAFIAKYIK